MLQLHRRARSAGRGRTGAAIAPREGGGLHGQATAQRTQLQAELHVLEIDEKGFVHAPGFSRIARSASTQEVETRRASRVRTGRGPAWRVRGATPSCRRSGRQQDPPGLRLP